MASLKNYILFALFCLVCSMTLAQSSYLPYYHEAYEFVDRLAHIYEPDSTYHYATKKLKIDDTRSLFSNYQKGNCTSTDSALLIYYQYDLGFAEDYFPNRKGFFNIFYKNPAHTFEFKSEDFELTINTITDFRGGHEAEDDQFIFLNTRGIDLWGKLDERFYFYTSIFENQSNFLNYIDDFIAEKQAIPGYGHFRAYESSVISALQGYDYANSRAFLGYKISRHTELELGHGNHFFGNGVRSLLLSDFSHNYFYLRFGLNIWKLNYQSIVGELSPISSIQTVGNTVLPKKYFATHFLNIKISRQLELGLFESVVFARQNQFEFQYLNPVILYRTVEALFDSPDNVLLGMNLNWFVFGNTSVYGQLLLDELRTSEIFSDRAWWGNKYAIQLGLKSYNLLGVPNLDLRLEYNRARPYTYSHNARLNAFPELSATSYSHFNQALAHPLGSNFTEYILRLKYKPVPSIGCRMQYIYARQGRNFNDLNFGSDILINNSSRIDDFGISHLQGAQSKIHNLDMHISYRFLYDFFVDAYFRIRQDKSLELGTVKTRYWGLGLRYNIENINIDY